MGNRFVTFPPAVTDTYSISLRTQIAHTDFFRFPTEASTLPSYVGAEPSLVDLQPFFTGLFKHLFLLATEPAFRSVRHANA